MCLDTDTDRPITVFSPSFRIDECLAEVRECLERGWSGAGYKTIAFETAWKASTGLPHAHFLNSASAGLFLAVELMKRRFGWSPEDEIVSTPITFVSTNHAVRAAGLKLVFADVDETGCLDPVSVLDRLTPRTRAVIFVGLGGNCGQYAAVEELCQQRGLKIILDGAHLAGTRLNGATVGLAADASIYSFQAVKNLPTADSGMLCFKQANLDEEARQASWLGITKDTYSRLDQGKSYVWDYDVPSLGYKLHGNAIMAALALVQLRYLEEDNETRRRLAGWYDEALDGLDQIETVRTAPGCLSSRHLYQILTRDRDEVIDRLNQARIFPGVHYRNNQDFTFYKEMKTHCPRAAWFSDRVISLPVQIGMSHQEALMVCRVLAEAVANRVP